MKKKKKNTIALLVRFIPSLDEKGSKMRIKQSDTGKKCIIDFDYASGSIIDRVESYLEKIDSVISYNLIIDNISDSDDFVVNISNDFIINVETKNAYPFPDLIQEIMNLLH